MAQTSSAHAPLARNTVLAKRYRIEQLIGSGGYANVYRGVDVDLGYERAVKEVIATEPGLRKQFQLESELLINTKHPNIPQGYALFEDRGRMYLVMDYVYGKDLEEILNDSLVQRGRPLDEAPVLNWMIEICDALTVMHSLRVPIIHRDIKPANIKITPEDRPVLIDFGLAKLHRQGSPTMTAAQGVSPGFAPPEQYMAKGRTDRRTDIYGLGATLYAALTGKDPPEAPSRLLAQSGAGMGGAALAPPRKWNPRVSDATNRLILKALELSPNHRQQDAAELQSELESALSGLQGGSTPGMTAKHSMFPANPPSTGKRAAVPSPPVGGTGKRGAVASPPAGGAGKQPAMAGATSLGVTGLQAAAPGGAKQQSLLGRASAKQPAVLGGTSKQSNVAAAPAAKPAKGTSKQPALPPLGAYGTVSEVYPPEAPSAKRNAIAAPKGTAKAAAVAPRPVVDAPPAAKTSAGSPARKGKFIGVFGKWILSISLLQTLWGVGVLLLGLYAASHVGEPLPYRQLAVGWGVVALLVGLVGAAVLVRPIRRRGNIRDGRRIAQGIGIMFYSIAVHAVAVYGLLTYQHTHFSLTGPGMWVAVASFVLFGLCVAFGGILAILNVIN